ncbi:uncharacterized protein LOC110022529 isoform X2 [Phalaenopsis equestris]|uniref:uncharacterized protein LOC110022529 isoform X2 n=1 Tax=Phalaenopsis equestris TaxID=78828 RepID=UPI0009E2AB66|nr:uncharacterized protein LOC110022529 isoform X2 [Phalaenopsis equestris]
MTKRAFAEVSGHHVEQWRSKRKEVELDEASVENNGFVAFLNGDAEAQAVVDSAGKIAEASTTGSYSSQKEFSYSDALLSNKADALAGSSRSCSEQSLVFSATTPYLVPNKESQRSNFFQSGEALLSQVDQAFPSSDTSSEATHSATVNRYLSLDEKDNNAFKESISHEELENQNDCKSTLKLQNTSLKRKKDSMPDFTENGSEKKVRLDFSSSKNLVDVNNGLTEPGGEFSEIRNNINGETDSQFYINEGILSKAIAAENDIVDGTSNYPSHSTKVATEHKIDSTPPVTECRHNENSEMAYQKTIKETEENLAGRSVSSTISIEINQKVLYANFKAELSLPPSPITGVVDWVVGKSYGDNNRLDSLNEEETTFSFQTSNKTKEVPKCEIGFDYSQNLSEHPLKFMSAGINVDKATQGKERIASSFSFASEEKEKEVQEIGSMPPERLVTGGARKKLLVLDLNGLLCDIVNDYYSNYRVEKKIGGKPIFKRPFCDDFLKFCFDNFHIGIWSSRRKYNVDSALDYLMGEYKHKLLFCWDQSKCTYTGARTIENHHKPLVLKELKKLWNKEESDLPWEKGDFSPSNTLLLDDSPYKALCNPPHTAIFPYPFQYTDERDNSLGPGGDVRVYLEQLLSSDDVQRFVEDHPFGQPAITASDQNWFFYCQIIKSNSTQLS